MGNVGNQRAGWQSWFSHLSYGFLGLNSGQQWWQQVPFLLSCLLGPGPNATVILIDGDSRSATSKGPGTWAGDCGN